VELVVGVKPVQKVLMGEMTWAEVQTALDNGYTTALIMLGSQEQHGLHLPLNTDTLIAQALGEGIARESGKALVAAVIPLGCSSEHRGFAGLLTLNEETLSDVIVDCLLSLSSQGFKRVAVFSAHGGNYTALKRLAEKLTYHQLSMQIIIQKPGTGLFRAEPQNLAVAGLHAGELETSLILHLRPDLVQMDKAQAGFVGEPAKAVRFFESGEPLQKLSNIGVVGDPTPATPERGAEYLRTAITRALYILDRK
jgi:creatinine amidohydrolase/Fe(II)-dependent formamide hydrolase-like protein